MICIEYVVIRQSILIILQIIVVSGVMVEVWTELEAGPHSNSFYQGLMWTYGIEPFYISGTNPHRWEALLQLNVDHDDSMIWDWDLILLAGCCHTLDLQLWDRCSLKELQVDGWLTWWCYSATDWFAFACSPIFALAASYPFGSWFTWVFIRVFIAIVPPAPLKRLVMRKMDQPSTQCILSSLWISC